MACLAHRIGSFLVVSVSQQQVSITSILPETYQHCQAFWWVLRKQAFPQKENTRGGGVPSPWCVAGGLKASQLHELLLHAFCCGKRLLHSLRRAALFKRLVAQVL